MVIVIGIYSLTLLAFLAAWSGKARMTCKSCGQDIGATSGFQKCVACLVEEDLDRLMED